MALISILISDKPVLFINGLKLWQLLKSLRKTSRNYNFIRQGQRSHGDWTSRVYLMDRREYTGRHWIVILPL
mgnify:CR=1 FL=1